MNKTDKKIIELIKCWGYMVFFLCGITLLIYDIYKSKYSWFIGIGLTFFGILWLKFHNE